MLLTLALLFSACGPAPAPEGGWGAEIPPAAVPAAAVAAGLSPGEAAAVVESGQAYGAQVTLAGVDIPAESALLGNTLAAMPTGADLPMPSAPGTSTASNKKAVIDYSNSSSGYVMICYAKATSLKLKVQIAGPSGVTYTYNLNGSGDYEAFPLSDGNGRYKISVYENISRDSYALANSASLDVSLISEYAPFLLPNQYVNYGPDSAVVVKARELTQGISDTLDKVTAIYNFVVHTFTYDYQLAATVASGYVPDVDAVLAKGSGICFDYAAVITAMLRSQNIPTKLVVGYSGSIYHAWISTWSAEQGWINGVIYFDGVTWKLLDPTFASSQKTSQAIMDYIADSANYTAKYLY